MASLLPPELFITEDRKGVWVLAEGQSIPFGSKFGEAVAKAPTAFEYPDRIPDLRGVFLRGTNAGRSDGRQDPDGASRKSGNYQPDALAAHSHRYGDSTAAGSGDANAWNAKPGNLGWETEKTGGAETRPKNVTVFYYIKVN